MPTAAQPLNSSYLNPNQGHPNLRRSDSTNSARPSITSISSYEINVEPPVSHFFFRFSSCYFANLVVSQIRHPQLRTDTMRHMNNTHHHKSIYSVHTSNPRLCPKCNKTNPSSHDVQTHLHFPFVYHIILHRVDKDQERRPQDEGEKHRQNQVPQLYPPPMLKLSRQALYPMYSHLILRLQLRFLQIYHLGLCRRLSQIRLQG